jgi:hypothetical protein
MDSFVPLSDAEETFLNRMAGLLEAPPATWPPGVRAAALRVAYAMREQRVPEAQDLSLVVFILLDADSVAGHRADRALEGGVLPRAQRAAAAIRVRLGLPTLSKPPSVEIVGRTYVYFPPAPSPQRA